MAAGRRNGGQAAGPQTAGGKAQVLDAPPVLDADPDSGDPAAAGTWPCLLRESSEGGSKFSAFQFYHGTGALVK